MRHDMNTTALNTQQRVHLVRRELRDGNNPVTSLRRFARLRGEARAKVGRRIFPRHHKEVVERCHRPPGLVVHALVQRMEDVGSWSAAQQSPMGIARQCLPQRTQEPVRPVIEVELFFGMRLRQSKQNLARVHADSRKIPAQAISCVECDRHD